MYYTTYGEKQGQCGHAHRSVDLAQACLVVKAQLFASFDRRVVAIDSTGLLAEIDEAGRPTVGVKLPGLGLGTVQLIQHDGKGGVTIEDRPFVIQNDGAHADLGTLTP